MHAAVALTPLLLFLAGPPAGDDNGARRMGGDWIAYGIHRSTDSGTPAARSRAGGGFTNCRSIPGEGQISYVQCDEGPDGKKNMFNAATPADPAITPEMLMEQALRELTPSKPKIVTAPPRGKPGYVGLRQFFWFEPGQWHAISRKATAGPVWAEVTATPSVLTIQPGERQSTLTCRGPGVPYDLTKSPDEQNSECTHVFTQSSAGLPNSEYRVKATVTWSAAWSGSGGSGGTLAPITTSATFPLRIGEAPALVGRDS
ncbi:hypothetical protein HCN51_52705 [Nonomuraea sp. FMUSA5-5]|uniref:ATP/GTP-binding protein n=1 Tax=Nonomuraea composti TaxID=2720023 RepID=A0ABX1BJT2_9ACTN|nr:hypothetical protein [Nonomuraea sp. FMUSA5-5]NJP97995.1 hypothetical protein [Nonomuraea sp. FMUSA5-5]